MRITRFTPAQRVFHLLLLLSFMTLAVTGTARLFYETRWGHFITSLFGGYPASEHIHAGVGFFLIALLVVHIIYLAFTVRVADLRGPDSLLPVRRDGQVLVQQTKWIVGRGAQPRFERWTWWEKFDYWAVFWGVVILGVTGLILAFPLASARIVPGWVLNLVLWVHRIEAILAMGHVFIIHFFIAHLRREAFPMDYAMFEGSVDVERLRHERPEWAERLAREGRLARGTTARTSPGLRIAYLVFGWLVIAIGVYLLVNGIMNARYVTW